VITSNLGADRAEKHFFCALACTDVAKKQHIFIINWLLQQYPRKLAILIATSDWQASLGCGS